MCVFVCILVVGTLAYVLVESLMTTRENHTCVLKLVILSHNTSRIYFQLMHFYKDKKTY